ncbi:hypothetical protein DL766_009318 [Monosporascus sp. MC13-8B]|uniref:Uncharacterized protein n=1 Tax=Monosporascus cannonballus TaxID=155416 RepID=A0ABY0GWR6_9PEZI|nr:hypothetical protein DL762_009657 [Monosporascus cannonballus]RYO93343.1 hypothetical protein DL763_004442 [Monosporascus cannonballus]RYP15800.1 hypothetical protein DL766_009318 [Monosporascus sp. MC13-8B]
MDSPPPPAKGSSSAPSSPTDDPLSDERRQSPQENRDAIQVLYGLLISSPFHPDSAHAVALRRYTEALRRLPWPIPGGSPDPFNILTQPGVMACLKSQGLSDSSSAKGSSGRSAVPDAARMSAESGSRPNTLPPRAPVPGPHPARSGQHYLGAPIPGYRDAMEPSSASTFYAELPPAAPHHPVSSGQQGTVSPTAPAPGQQGAMGPAPAPRQQVPMGPPPLPGSSSGQPSTTSRAEPPQLLEYYVEKLKRELVATAEMCELTPRMLLSLAAVPSKDAQQDQARSHFRDQVVQHSRRIAREFGCTDGFVRDMVHAKLAADEL